MKGVPYFLNTLYYRHGDDYYESKKHKKILKGD